MAQDTGEHDAHVGPGVHLPDPTMWPFVAGLAAMLLSVALVWWARVDDQRDVSGPLLGAAAAVTLFTVAGWGYEDGRMRQKARAQDEREGQAAKRTQLITFAVAEGEIGAATAMGGIVDAIQEAHAELRAAPGFEDLRINVSPADVGPSQVIVETTWSTSEELAAFEETERTIIDLINRHPEEIVPGSVQTFDMQVVRDTKDTSVRFGLGAATALLGSLIVGGFAIGAGLTLFEGEGGEGGVTGPMIDGPGDFEGTVTAKSTAFDFKEITLPPAADLTIVIDNQDDLVAHNIAFFQGEEPGAGPYLQGCSAGCEEAPDVRTALRLGIVTQEFSFTTPAPGRYGFLCEVHPDTMRGVLIVAEGALLPGEEPPPPEPAEGEGEPAEGEGAAEA